MVGGFGGQDLPVPVDFPPGLPETVAIRQAIQAALRVETRLLQRLVLACHATRRPPCAAAVALAK
ncbi:hypothetical protein D3C81_1847880 [compost metagenome]